MPSAPVFTFVRNARVLLSGSEQNRRLAADALISELKSGDALALGDPCDAVVRQGNLRVCERLPSGREVTRAVLQTGAIYRVRESSADVSEAADSSLYSLAVIELIALTDTEIWMLPVGACDPS